jgi:outer membrane protein OmpA-like peptidoglycan-associated protein
MRKLILWRNVIVALFFLLFASACQGFGKRYPKVTTIESEPVPVTTLIEVEPVATTTLEVVGGNTATTLETSGQTLPATELNSEAQPTTQTEVETQPVSTTAVKSDPPPTTTTTTPPPVPEKPEPEPPTPPPVPEKPKPEPPTPPAVPVKPSQVETEPVPVTTTEVEETLTELKAERTIEGIKINLQDNILFEFDKYAVRSVAKPTLAKINQLLKHYKDAQVFIYGHTDSKGDDNYNLDLSNKRAAAVKYYFINVFQEQPTRLQTKGFGESKPIAPNNNPNGSDNPAGREKNRRVEFIIKTQTRTVVRSPGEDPFRDAVNSAQNAAVLVQNAKTAADWNKAANKWQEAIELMKEVPESSANYQIAQQRVAEYQKNLNYAQQNAELAAP